uniref:AIG1-type G domain-containing protein n=1 Tax=Denticeps clupeoides TaxID=299321 RepID=A0AAY4B8C0_9TELE
CVTIPSQLLRIVLIGKTGVGKSAFKSHPSASSVTKVCEKQHAFLNRQVFVIDTPGILDTEKTPEEIKKEIVKCIQMSSPGPHAFLLVLQLGRFTREEQNAVKALQEIFGKESTYYMIVVFTRASELQGQTIESYVQSGHEKLRELIRSCGARYVVLDNTRSQNRVQVQKLIGKIDEVVAANGGACYTEEMYKEAEAVLQSQTLDRVVAELQEYKFSFVESLLQKIMIFQAKLKEEP